MRKRPCFLTGNRNDGPEAAARPRPWYGSPGPRVPGSSAPQAGLAGADVSPESTSGSGSRPGVMMFNRLIMKLNTT